MAKEKSKSARGVAPGYLHGFSPEEQERLYRQARFLEPTVYEGIDFSKPSSLIEVGCGVGAQTEILLERFPHVKILGVDASEVQIKTARSKLAEAIEAGRVKYEVADALHLPYDKSSFDGAFVCWLLEHVQRSVEILEEIHRVVKPGGVIYCTEVMNATFYVHPHSPATLEYWHAFNDHQLSLKGDPYIGAKLGNYLLKAGFQNVTTKPLLYFYDNRAPKRRAEFIEYWTRLLLSGAPGLTDAGKVSQKTVDQMTEELERLKDDPDAVFFYVGMQARAQAF